jgi:hypothetical protein
MKSFRINRWTGIALLIFGIGVVLFAVGFQL